MAVFLFGTGDGNDAGGSTNGGKTKEVDARTFVVSSAKYITIDYSTVTKELNNIEDVLKSGNVPSATSSKYVSFLGDTRSQLLESKNSWTKNCGTSTAGLIRWGNAQGRRRRTADHCEKRKEYNEEAVYQKGRIAENDLLINRIDELTALIVAVRKQALIGNPLVYQEPLIYPSSF